MDEYEIRVATLDEIMTLRHTELRPGRPAEAAIFEGDDEDDTRHTGAFLGPDGPAVGCATLVQRAAEGARHQLRGMATRRDLDRRGIGRRLLAFTERLARKELGAEVLWCNARIEAVGFYEQYGWRVVSEVFDVPDVGPHRRMLRDRLGRRLA